MGTQAEAGGMQPQAKGHPEPPGAGRGERVLWWSLQKQPMLTTP